jgi:hypothetical protein
VVPLGSATAKPHRRHDLSVEEAGDRIDDLDLLSCTTQLSLHKMGDGS